MGKYLAMFSRKGDDKIMKKAIYIITNNINHKQYIGQSKNPKERFQSHCYPSRLKDNSLIDKAIQKYGKDNFSLHILGWYENYNEMEKYYIKLYKTRIPNGYNIQEGGKLPPLHLGEKHPQAKITQEIALNIIEDLKNWFMPLNQICAKYRITRDMLRHIKDGTSWRQANEKYPLRPTESYIHNLKADKVKKLLKTTNLSQKEIGKQVGWNRSAVTMINIGKNHFDPNENYPIRK